MEPMPPDVRAAFDAFPRVARERLHAVRAMIFDLAGQDPAIGPISETLKWGEPAYLTATSGSGSTIRLGVSRTAAGRPAIFFNCRTTLVDEFRDRFGAAFDYEGNRAVLLPEAGAGERGPLEFMLGRALTYHVRRRA
ncbi:MAG: DUF1801 domain-containing protein [Rhizobiaceae bacterium]|nr:DUF1801 domain-containing protein [Rhizobiaceae bacterium]